MARLALYHFLIIVPLLPIVTLMLQRSVWFIYLTPAYLLYRLILDRHKLVRKGLISRETSLWHVAIHAHIDYFRQLYLEP